MWTHRDFSSLSLSLAGERFENAWVKAGYPLRFENSLPLTTWAKVGEKAQRIFPFRPRHWYTHFNKTSLLKRSYDRDLPETTGNQIDQKAVCIHQDYSASSFSVNGIDRQIWKSQTSAVSAGITMYETGNFKVYPIWPSGPKAENQFLSHIASSFKVSFFGNDREHEGDHRDPNSRIVSADSIAWYYSIPPGYWDLHTIIE